MDSGIYRDYKGNHVQVFGLGQHTESGEPLVVFVALTPGRGPQLQCCPQVVFTENVEVGTNLFTPRYEYVGEQLR